MTMKRSSFGRSGNVALASANEGSDSLFEASIPGNSKVATILDSQFRRKGGCRSPRSPLAEEFVPLVRPLPEESNFWYVGKGVETVSLTELR